MFATPAVAGDRLFIGSCAGKFYAVDRQSGRVLWTHEVAAEKGHANFHGDSIFAGESIVTDTDGVSPDAGYIWAFDRNTGDLRWNFHVPEGATTDLVQLGGAIFAGSSTGRLISIDAANGKLRWELPPTREALFYTQAPIVDDSRILFSDPAGGIVAVNAASGAVVWQRAISSQTPLLIALAGRDLYAASQSTHEIYRVDAEGGVLKSTFALPAAPRWRLAATDSCVLTTLEDNSLLCLDRDLESVRWRQTLPAEISTKQPFTRADAVLVGTATGVLSAFRLADGKAEWSYTLGGRIVSVASSESVLYVGTRQGVVSAIRPEED